MKTSQFAIWGVAFCIATAVWVWWSTPEAPRQGVTLAQSVAPTKANTNALGAPPSDHVASSGASGKPAVASTTNDALEVLLAQATTSSLSPADGEAAREKLRNLAIEDAAVARWLLQSYDKAYNSRSRGLIISLLFEIETPEVLAFSKRLASSSNLEQQRDGFAMLQNLPRDLPEMRPIILQTLSGNHPPESVLMALAALRPPTPSGSDLPQTDLTSPHAATVVTTLQKLTRNSAPEVRVESILQLAQWDQTGSSQAQWANALADLSPRVREAAVVAVTQSGAKSDLVKTALIGMAHNPKESNDVRVNALLVLGDFPLSPEETRDLGKLRSQLVGS